MSDEILSLENIRANESWLRPLLRALVDDATASDVMQQTWLRAWQKPPRAAGALRAWLTTVATRLAISHRRQERRRQRCEAAVERTDATDSTLETVERLAVQRAVSEAVTNARGAYVAGARVGLGHWTTTTGPYGDFALELEAGASTDRSQSLYAAHEGWYPAVVAGFGERLQSVEGAVEQNLQLQQPSLRITGRVVDVHGAPCAGVHVYPWLLSMLSERETAEDLAAPLAGAPLSLTGNLVRSFGSTDADGRFAVPGLGQRAYHLRVYDEKGGWAWTTPPIEGGTEDALVTLPVEPLGPVAGTLVTRDGGPAAGVNVDAYVEVFATVGGSAATGLPISVQTDAEGHFRIARMPRLGVYLGCGGKGWIEQSIELDKAAGAENLRLVMLRRCHVRVELADAAWANGKIRFLDANDALLAIVEERGNTRISRDVHDLHDGKTEVLAVSESAVLLVVASADGKREQRMPIALRAGDIQIVR